MVGEHLSKVGYVLCADRLRTLHVDLRHAKIACGIDDGLVLEGREPAVERRELRRSIERGILPHETELYALTERLPETPHKGDALVTVSRQDEMTDEDAAQETPVRGKLQCADLLDHGTERGKRRRCVVGGGRVEPSALLCVLLEIGQVAIHRAREACDILLRLIAARVPDDRDGQPF